MLEQVGRTSCAPSDFLLRYGTWEKMRDGRSRAEFALGLRSACAVDQVADLARPRSDVVRQVAGVVDQVVELLHQDGVVVGQVAEVDQDATSVVDQVIVLVEHVDDLVNGEPWP